MKKVGKGILIGVVVIASVLAIPIGGPLWGAAAIVLITKI